MPAHYDLTLAASEGGYQNGVYKTVGFIQYSLSDASLLSFDPVTHKLKALKSGIITFEFNIWWIIGAINCSNAVYVAKFKRTGGADIKAFTGVPDASAPGKAWTTGACSTICAQNEEFWLDLNGDTTPGSTLTIDGNPAHTWWSGLFFPDAG